MTTQELKEYIGRVLGNSIRCLLPSYWWKRLFGLVVDKVEEVEGSIVTSIDEFAKNRPDIYERTFYLSERAEHIAHNAKVVIKCQMEAMRGTLRPYYIATMIEDSPEIWWIRNDGHAPTSGISTFIDVEDGGNKYNVMFFSDGTAYKVEAQEDSVIVDTEMSSTSENAVQNKVITKALDDKVDKVDGKQLSTEDFTTALKTKLEGMSSFDPTEINNKVDGLQSQINTLVSGDASTAIESFNEIIAFLNGVQDSESLEGIIAGIEQQIAAKQDKIADLETIRSGATLGATAIQSVKTINGESIVGDGNIEIKADVDTSTLATKDEVTSLSNEVVANEEVTAAALNELNERVNAISENVSGETATKVELQTAVESLTNTILENEEVHAAALNDLNERIENAGGGNVDLSSYATKQEVKEGLNGKQDEIADLETIRSGASKGATALQSYTEKYTGTYSKPSTGIPKTDLDSTVQTSLGKADTALQSVPDTYATKTNLAEALAPIGTLYKGAWTATKTEGISQLYTERITVPAGTYIISAVLPYAKVGHGNQICIGFTAKMAIGVGNTFLDASYGCTTMIAQFTATTSIAVMSAASANSAEWDYLDSGGIAALRIA